MQDFAKGGKKVASKKIKGITIEIGGDTRPLGKALQDTEKPVKTIQTELKNVNRLLQFDEDNSELIAQKQELLSDSVAATAQKLELLRAAQEKVNKAHEANAEWEKQYFPIQKAIEETEKKMKSLVAQESQMKAKLESGEISTESYQKYQDSLKSVEDEHKQLKSSLRDLEKQFESTGHIDDKGYREFQRELAATEKNSENLRKELYLLQSQLSEASKKAQEIGENWEKAGDKISGVGDQMNQKATLPIVAFGTAAVVASENAESAASKFETRLGSTKEETEKLKKVMEDIGTTGVGNFGEISDAVISVKQNMKGVSDGQITEVTEEAMQLAAVMEKDVSNVTRAAGSIMTHFGKDGQSALDLIAKGYQKGLNFSGEFLDVLFEYPVHFKSLGFTAEDMFNIMIKGSQEGAWNLDKVGDAIKEGNIRMKDLSDGSKEAFEALGLDAETMFNDFASGGERAKMSFMTVTGALSKIEDETKRNQIGVALFGTQYEDLEKTVVSSFSSITDEMGKYSGTAKKVAEDNKTLKQETQAIWNDLQKEIAPLGKSLTKAMKSAKPVITDIIGTLGKLIDKFADLSPEQQKFVLGLAAISAAAGPVTKTIGTLTSGTGKLIKFLGDTGKSMAEFSAKTKAAHDAAQGASVSIGGLGSGSTQAAGGIGLLKTAMGALTSPIGIAIGVTGAAAVGIKLMADSYEASMKRVSDSITGCLPNFETWEQDMQGAESALENFNLESSEFGEKISEYEEHIISAKENIHSIAQTAADESRALTDKERKEIENLVNLIDEYTQKKLEAYMQQQQLVSTMATQEKEMTKTRAQELIKAAEEAKNQTMAIAEAKYQEELAKAEQQYGHLGELDKAAYDKMVMNAQTAYDQQIADANNYYGETYGIVQKAYYDRNILDNENIVKAQEYIQRMEELENNHASAIKQIENDSTLTLQEQARKKYYINMQYQEDMRKCKEGLASVLDQQTQDQLSAWLTMAANTEVYGGKTTNEQRKFVKNFLSVTDYLPENMVKTAKDAMEGFNQGMKEKEPGLLSRAKRIADGILSTLNRTFDIHSPSRVMKKMAGHVWGGFEKQTDIEAKKIFKQTDVIGKSIINSMDLKNGLLDFGIIRPELVGYGAGDSFFGSEKKSNTVKNLPTQTVVNFNGNYRFNNKEDMDYFLNEVAIRLAGIR